MRVCRNSAGTAASRAFPYSSRRQSCALFRKGVLVASSCIVSTFGASSVSAGSHVQGAGVGHVDGRVLEYVPSDPGKLRADATLGALVRAGIGHSSFPLLYAGGLDYRFGAALPAGFIFDANLLPFGIGATAGQLGMLMVTGGVGVSGATGGLLEISAQLPLESRLEFDLPAALHGSLWLRTSWLAAEARHNAAAVDEVAAGFALRVGREDARWGYAYGSGFCIGTVYINRAGTRALGIVIGHELDGVFEF